MSLPEPGLVMLHRALYFCHALRVTLLLLLLVPAAVPAAAGDASATDVARVLAGLAVSEGSPLAKVTARPEWRAHARQMDSAWSRYETRQRARMRAWSKSHLEGPHETLFYVFSGPDFLHAEALFPAARTYVMIGLEPPGPTPAFDRFERNGIAYGLAQLRQSLATVLSVSFFITRDMRETLPGNVFSGTVPILLVFLARAGKTIESVMPIAIDRAGVVSDRLAGSSLRKGESGGVRIRFADADGTKRVLYYISADLSDRAVRESGVLAFLEALGFGDSLIKSASYLLHGASFTRIREFLLRRSRRIVQDDSGIPLAEFKTGEWQFRLYGRYIGPIEMFAGNYQQRLARLFSGGRPSALDFGIGYQFRPSQSNLLVADRMPTTAER